MTLLEEIQDAAIDGGSDLGTLLRKCKLLAARLGSKPLEEWLLWESNGYPDGIAVPDYRVWPLQVKGHFAGGFGSAIRNAPIPLVSLPERAREVYEKYECRESVANIEHLLKENTAGTLLVSTGDLAVLLGTTVYKHYSCLEAWAESSRGHLVELLNSVRNRILDFVLAVGKEQPTAGEPKGNQTKAIEASKVTHIFNTTVYNGSANLVGTANASHITFNVGAADFSSVERVLREHRVSEEDIKELHNALESEQRPVSAEAYGPKVSSWIGKMFKKAAEGTWNLSVATTAQILPKLIAQYYGLE